MATDVWTTTGYSAVIYLAALASVDVSLYEAAKIDGASRLQKIRHVDLPALMPTATIILILGVGNIMAIGFEKAFLLQNALNLSTSEIIPTYVYKTGILNANFSLGATIGLVQRRDQSRAPPRRQHSVQASHGKRAVVSNVISKEAVLVEEAAVGAVAAPSLTGGRGAGGPRRAV